MIYVSAVPRYYTVQPHSHLICDYAQMAWLRLARMSSANGGANSNNQADIADLLWRAFVSVIHKATLQDLLCCSNDAVHQLLLERNTLLQER